MGDRINSKDATGRNALLYSIESADFVTFRMLIEHGAHVDSTDDDMGFSALTYSILLTNVSPKFAQLLIENNADVNKCDGHMRTPLMHAQNGEKARLLIDNGADMTHRDENGRTPLMAASACDTVSEELIRSGGLDLDAKDNSGKTILEMASERPDSYCSRECVRVCLQKLADYFANSSPEEIRKDMQTCVTISDPESFPIKSHHFLALNVAEKIKISNQENFIKEKLLKCLGYFSSQDFQEKLWADVIQQLDENNILVDGQILRIQLARAKNEPDTLDRLNRVYELVKSKRQIAIEFYELTREKNSEN